MDTKFLSTLQDTLTWAFKSDPCPTEVSRAGRALFISWDGAPAFDEVHEIRQTLQRRFGYDIEDLRLPENAESSKSSLKDAVHRLVDICKKENSLFMIHYRGPVQMEGGELTWKSYDGMRQIPSASIQSELERHPVDVLLITHYEDVSSQDDGSITPRSSVLSDARNGRLEMISSRSNLFGQHLMRVLQEKPGPEFSVHELYLALIEDDRAVHYANWSSSTEASSISLVPISQPSPVSLIRYTYDVFVLEHLKNDDEQSMMRCKEWFRQRPVSAQTIRLFDSRKGSSAELKDHDSTIPLSLSIESQPSATALEDIGQWIHRVPSFLTIRGGRPVEHGLKTQTKGAQAADLESWVSRINRDPRCFGVTTTRQRRYRKVTLLPIRWDNDTFDSKGEIDDLKSVFGEYFDCVIEDDLVLSKTATELTAQERVDAHIDSYIDSGTSNSLTANDLLIVIYNGHGLDGYRTQGTMRFSSGIAKDFVDWTKIVSRLDKAVFDVLQIIDCCYAGTAVKTGKPKNETQRRTEREPEALLHTIHAKTEATEYRGLNETFASSSRDAEAHAGPRSAMPLFADVLRELARKGDPVTVYRWFHRCDSKIVQKNIQIANGVENMKPYNWYVSPVHKVHPESSYADSILLQRKDSHPSSTSSTSQECVYAKIKLLGRECTGETYIYTEEQLRKEFNSMGTSGQNLLK